MKNFIKRSNSCSCLSCGICKKLHKANIILNEKDIENNIINLTN